MRATAIAFCVAAQTAGSYHDEAAHCLALAVYHEARSEIQIAQLGVMHVVLNRSAFEPGTICDIVRRYQQFHVPHMPRADDDAWIAAQVLVANALHFRVPDPTGGAVYFLSDDKPRPWTRGMMPLRLGRLTFWRTK
jgi:spore germination cell wall hydrolase CwlJ-like protein